MTTIIKSPDSPDYPPTFYALRKIIGCGLLLLALTISSYSGMQAQCTFSSAEVDTLAADFDMDPNPPYTTTYPVLTATTSASSISVTSSATVIICFYGDMDAANETWTTQIEGQSFTGSGAYGTTPTAANPACETFTVPQTAISTGIQDGDLDITYTSFGAGWDDNNDAVNEVGDEFNAFVSSVQFDFEVDITIAGSAESSCQDGADITFSGTPVVGTFAGDAETYEISPLTAGFNASTGTLDVSATDAELYIVQRTYTVNGCEYSTESTVSVFDIPVPTIEDAAVDCGVSSINLTTLFTDEITEDGTFTTTTDGATITGNTLSYDSTGCVDVVYTASNVNSCTGAPYEDNATIFFPENVSPDFSITSSTTCWDGAAPLTIELERTSPDYDNTPTLEWSATGSGIEVTITNTTDDVPTLSVSQGSSTVGTVRICLSESITTTDTCNDDVECSQIRCREITISSVGCNEECNLFDPQTTVCPILTNSSFGFTIFGVTIDFGTFTGFDLYEASVVPGEYVLENNPSEGGTLDADLSCTDDGIQVSWDAAINDAIFGDDPALDESIIDQVGADFICDAAMFGIPFPDRFCGDCGPKDDPSICANVLGIRPCIVIEEFMPLEFLDFEIDGFGSLCSVTPRSLIIDPIQQSIETSSVAVVWADTDGDGAFDTVLEQGGIIFDGSAAGTAFVPNNVPGEGVITVRNVAAAVIAPYSPCVSPEGQNLFDIIPIDFIPIGGPIIKQFLETAGLDINIAPSDVADLPIAVSNDQDPQFLNFPSQYVFSTGDACSTPANWSIPVAIDACSGVIIEDVAQTGGPMPGDVLTVPNPNPVDPDNPNLYRVEYTATACNGRTFVDSFDIVVSSGAPELICPNDFTLSNDVDQCSRVVTGLTPLSGIGCNTDVTWTAPGASPASGVNDASGTTFPVGTTTVTYTMTYVDGDGETQTETCGFDVTIEDAQKPTAQCLDFEVQLDAQGAATVSVADVEGGSSDNCTATNLLDFSLASTDMVFGDEVTFDCFDEGQNTVILRVLDEAQNERRCLSLITVRDHFEDFTLTLDVPELCLETSNEEQLEFGNYLTIAYPDGATLNHLQELGDGDEIGGVFGITGYAPSVPGASTTRGTSPDEPGDAGYIDPVTGVYTPGTGSGFVTISYVLGIGDQVDIGADNQSLDGCFIMTTDVFELRQPLDMASPECECIVQNDRIVNLGEITGGLEPYTIQYSGVKLDVDNDGIADDLDGEFEYLGTFSGSAGTMVIDTNDFVEDLGQLLVDYTQPTWSFTILDARGCELFRSGSCDNDDENGTPEILCEDLGPVALTTDELVCEAQYTWAHTLPTDNCDVTLYTYTITNPDGSTAGPFDLTALLNPDITNPLPDQFNGTYNFQHVSPTQRTSTVTYYAEDAVGNFTQCSFEVTISDDDAPRFINCPEPAVIVDAPATLCAAFANYSLPLAVDNCDLPTVTQVDDTGLTSGDLYPVGITINTFEAVDATGNTTRCDVKIVVNDYLTPPSFECPASVTQDNDEGDCGAIVEGIAPTAIEDNCVDNLTLVYRIEDEAGNEVASGFDDASGEFFDLGTSTVTYSVQDMPLLLVTEVTHDIDDPVDGTLPLPGFPAGITPAGDYLEITNFNRARLDVSCLMIERIHENGSEEFAVPTFTFLEPGGTLTIHFGDGTNVPGYDFFNVPGAVDLDKDDAAAYIVSLSRSILDIAVINGFDISTLSPPEYNLDGLTIGEYWSGDISPVYGSSIIRTTVWDTDSAADFAPGEACLPTTIGSLNPGLAQPTPNGTVTAIQAQPTVRVECAFDVTITDEEAAVCGLYSDYFDYTGGPISIEYGACVETVISVGDVYDIADLNLNLAGSAGDMGNLTFTLISPEGTAVELADAVCPGTDEIEFTFDGDFGPGIEAGCGILNNAGDLVMPVSDIEAFNGEAANGDWVLQIAHNGQQSTAPATIDSYILFISAREEYPDNSTTLGNDPGVCGAEYTWFHPVLFDNCPGGTVEMAITFEDGGVESQQTLEIFPENTEITYFFQVGVTSVEYTLTDAAGNSSSCGFDVTAEDWEDPTLVCPEDITIQLEGGECDVVYIPQRPADWDTEDNCAVTQIIPSPDWNEPLPIGINDVMLTVRDAAGNDTTCTYVVTVLEYIPDNPQMACIGEINIHLPSDCEQVVIPSMVLAGNEYYCFDNYELTLFQEDENGEPVQLPDNFVGIDQIGATITYMVYDPRNDDSCWGVINVGFFEAPEFICPSNQTVSCNAETDTSLMGVPVLLSCATADATVSFADTLERFDACDDPRAILRRTWTVTDAYGNASSCVQRITIDAFNLTDVIFPADLDGDINPAISCVDAANDPTLTDPENTGFPTVADGSNIFTNNFCSASYLYDDEVYNICAGSYEIVRTWKVRNTCQPIMPGVNPREAVQIIRVLDQSNPVINLPEDVVVSTTGLSCEAFHVIVPPVVMESCSDFTFEISVSDGNLEPVGDGNFVLIGLSLGEYTVQYEVEDECGRYSEGRYTVTVVDQVAPTANCEDGLNVSLDGGGFALITAEDVDKQSSDHCSSVSLEVRRVFHQNEDCQVLQDSIFSDWGPTVEFGCCEVNSTVTVELRVADENQNTATCWTEVLVEDKQAPTCVAPADFNISCVDFRAAFAAGILDASDDELNAVFGTPFSSDNCVGYVITQTLEGEINNCGIGSFTRVFTSTDGVGLTNVAPCVQQVNVYEVFDYTITLPTDADGSCADIPSFAGLSVDEFACDLITTDIVTDTLVSDNAPEACFTLRVTYDVINFCEYNQLGEAYLIPRDGDGIRDPKTQPLYLTVSAGPDQTSPDDDFAFLSRFTDRNYNPGAPQNDQLIDDGDDNDGSDDDNSNDSEQDQAPNGVGFAYAADDSRGHFRYIQFIDVYDGDAPVIVGDTPAECFAGANSDCTADVTLAFTAADDCSAAIVSVELDRDYVAANGFSPVAAAAIGVDIAISNDSINYTLQATNVPVGTHAIRVRADDGCGNHDLEIIEFCVTADKAPTPICVQTLTVTLMPDGAGGGMGSIWASDFIASDIDDCFGNQIENYSIYREEGFDESSIAVGDLGLEFTCNDLGEVPVRVYAIAANETADYCSVVVEVQAFQPALCGQEGGTLAGTIMTDGMTTIQDVEVTLEGANDFTTSVTTEESGTFLFTGLGLGIDYTITPTQRTDYLNGVRTSDIVGITQHILGFEFLDSPYKYIAADVDGNEEINVGDIINIRRLIIGLADVFPNDMPSWAFVPADHEFANVNSPWAEAFPSVININDLSSNTLDADFVGIKLGDVNSSATANLTEPVAPRNIRGFLDLEVDDVDLKAGETYTIPVTAPRLTDFKGYQFTLEFDRSTLTIERIEPGLVDRGNFGWRFTDRGLITTSWNWGGSGVPTDWTGEEVLFSLVVQAIANDKLSNSIQVGSRFTEAEAYRADSDDLSSVALSFNQDDAENAGYKLFQNIPNPVAKETLIGFELPVAEAEVVVRILDAAGRLLQEFRQPGQVGYNSLRLPISVFHNTSGVYSYVVSAGNWRATKRMVVIE